MKKKVRVHESIKQENLLHNQAKAAQDINVKIDLYTKACQKNEAAFEDLKSLPQTPEVTKNLTIRLENRTLILENLFRLKSEKAGVFGQSNFDVTNSLVRLYADASRASDGDDAARVTAYIQDLDDVISIDGKLTEVYRQSDKNERAQSHGRTNCRSIKQPCSAIQ